LYGESRKPTPEMLDGLEALIIDLQDVGTRVYTYIWTIKLCMEACNEAGLPIWILDRPNPISVMRFDGPMLSPDLFTFVGGAEIPLCHRMTIGEMASLMRAAYFPKLDLNVVWMEGWWRDSLFSDLGLPWVLPSPNMPTLDTAIVYPGMVLLEATTLSEGRGTTTPFELFGAPYVNVKQLKEKLPRLTIPGCVFREHAFIPSFQKWRQEYCYGMQVHVTNPRKYSPVLTTVAILSEISQTANPGFELIGPPYEYEYEKRPFDMVAGNSYLGDQLKGPVNLEEIADQWREERKSFLIQFKEISRYPEEL
ncbi:DUF1343 domain-containing protein, partial [bacterium]|nr:DUF1343 domain-containing protein [bacterium]